MSKQYKVTLKPSFPVETRHRAGITIPRAGGAIVTVTKGDDVGDLEVTAAGLKELQNDAELKVVELKGAPAPAAAKADVGGEPPVGTGTPPVTEGDDGESDKTPAPTKKELLDAAKAEGLELEGLTSKSTVAEIQAALDAARAAQGSKKLVDEPDDTKEL